MQTTCGLIHSVSGTLSVTFLPKNSHFSIIKLILEVYLKGDVRFRIWETLRFSTLRSQR